jgi:HAD superfamily hydrolase (TIGR01509 family)
MNTIRAIIFDGSGVITEENPHKTAHDLSLQYSISEDTIWESIFCKNYDLAAVGSISNQQYYQNVRAETHLPITYEAFIDIFLSGSLVRPDMVDLLKSIRPFVEHIILLSNQTKINTDYLHPILDPIIDASFYSNECHIMKPNPVFYCSVAESLPYSQSELLFIDDRESNLAYPKKLGWNVYHFLDSKTCISFLQNTIIDAHKS